MNLGQQIYELRTRNGLSQGDLAEALDVSRQSISKWETGASVPELDKLIRLSQLFGVTLDELVLDKTPKETPPPPEPKVIYVERQAPHSPKKTAGVVLLCFAALIWLLISLLGDVLTGLALASPFLACGLICLFVRKNVGLWCLWVVYAFADLYLRFATGVYWLFGFKRIAYTSFANPGHLIIAWSSFAIFATMTLATVLRFRKGRPTTIKANAIGVAVSWATWGLLVVLTVSVLTGPITDSSQIGVFRLSSAFVEWLRTVVVVVALTFTVRLITALWQKWKAQQTKT